MKNQDQQLGTSNYCFIIEEQQIGDTYYITHQCYKLSPPTYY